MFICSIITHKHISDLTFEAAYVFAKRLFDLLLNDIINPFAGIVNTKFGKIENERLASALEDLQLFYNSDKINNDDASFRKAYRI
jgi:hypothetical protein